MVMLQVRTCEFCNGEVFDDDRQVGGVRQKDNSVRWYHLDCLYDKYPEETNYQRLVFELFGEEGVDYGDEARYSI